MQLSVVPFRSLRHAQPWAIYMAILGTAVVAPFSWGEPSSLIYVTVAYVWSAFMTVHEYAGRTNAARAVAFAGVRLLMFGLVAVAQGVHFVGYGVFLMSITIGIVAVEEFMQRRWGKW